MADSLTSNQPCSICGAIGFCHHDDGPKLMAEIERLMRELQEWHDLVDGGAKVIPELKRLRAALERFEAWWDLPYPKEPLRKYVDSPLAGATDETTAVLCPRCEAPAGSPHCEDCPDNITNPSYP